MKNVENGHAPGISDDGTALPLPSTTTFYCDRTGDVASVLRLLNLAVRDSRWTIIITPGKFGDFSAITVTTVLSGDIEIAIYLGEWPTILIEELVGLYQTLNRGNVVDGNVNE